MWFIGKLVPSRTRAAHSWGVLDTSGVRDVARWAASLSVVALAGASACGTAGHAAVGAVPVDSGGNAGSGATGGQDGSVAGDSGAGGTGSGGTEAGAAGTGGAG